MCGFQALRQILLFKASFDDDRTENNNDNYYYYYCYYYYYYYYSNNNNFASNANLPTARQKNANLPFSCGNA